jgi:hypothetical protein
MKALAQCLELLSLEVLQAMYDELETYIFNTKDINKEDYARLSKYLSIVAMAKSEKWWDNHIATKEANNENA